MKKILSIGMALCVIFAIISCDTGSSPDTKEPQVPAGQSITIKYNANGWTLTDQIPAAATGVSGDPIGTQALPVLDDTDHPQRFLGWSLTSGQKGARITADYKPTTNITLYVLWQATVAEGGEVTITYNANGWTGGGIPPAAKGISGDSIGADKLPTLNSTEKQIFFGWSETAGQMGTRITSGYLLRGNTNLYVLYREPITITFNYNYDGAPAAPAPVKVGQDMTIGDILPVVYDTNNITGEQQPTRSGYLFQGWYDAAEEGTRATTNSRYIENITLFAQWTKEPTWAFMDIDLAMQAVIETSSGPWSGNGSGPWSVAENTYNADGSITWKFDRNDQRGIILFSPKQRAVLGKIDEFRMFIDGDATEGTGNFRDFIGWMGTSGDWNGTGAPAQTMWGDAFKTQDFVFNTNKNKNGTDDAPNSQDTRTASWILQHRTSDMTTVLNIKSIKIRYDQDMGGAAPSADTAVKISFNQNYEGAVGPNPLIIDKGGKITDAVWPKTNRLPTPIQDGFKFLGWFTAATGGTEVKETDTTTYNANTVLYAHWEEMLIAQPTITTQPAATTRVGLGEAMPQLSVVATSPNKGNVTYQWYKATSGTGFDTATSITGATGTNYTPTDSTTTQTIYYYFVKVTNTTASVTTETPADEYIRNSVMARVLVVDTTTPAADVVLLDNTYTGWDAAAGGVVKDVSAQYANLFTFQLDPFLDLTKYDRVEVIFDSYIGDELHTITDRFQNTIICNILVGSTSLGNFGYNSDGILSDPAGLSYTLVAAHKAGDFSGGNGTLTLSSKYGGSGDPHVITKVVCKSVKIILATQ
jgi:uncharacterized repeat protein (TIGR02543 family)